MPLSPPTPIPRPAWTCRYCWGSNWQAGVVVGCYLAEGGLDGRSALKRLNRLWRQSERAKSWPVVPQTVEQADYIRSWPHRRKLR